MCYLVAPRLLKCLQLGGLSVREGQLKEVALLPPIIFGVGAPMATYQWSQDSGAGLWGRGGWLHCGSRNSTSSFLSASSMNFDSTHLT